MLVVWAVVAREGVGIVGQGGELIMRVWALRFVSSPSESMSTVIFPGQGVMVLGVGKVSLWVSFLLEMGRYLWGCCLLFCWLGQVSTVSIAGGVLNLPV